MPSPAEVVSELQDIAGSLIPAGTFRAEFLRYGTLHAERFAHLINQIVKAGGREVLDAGSFPGHMAALLKSRGFAVTALNPPLESLLSYPQFQAFMDRLGVPALCGDLERDFLPLPAESFDQVVFTEVIEHLPFNPFHAVTELTRVLRPGGALWLSTPNLGSIRYILRLAAGRTLHRPLLSPWQNVFPTAPGAKHEREYTARELREFLQPGGRYPYHYDDPVVTARSWFSDDAPSNKAIVRLAEAWLERLVPGWGNGLFAGAVKQRGLLLRKPTELVTRGSLGDEFDPIREVRPPAPSPYPYPYRYVTGPVELEFDLPARTTPGQKANLLLPVVWHDTTPALPPVEWRLEAEGAAAALRIEPAPRVQWVAAGLGLPLGESARRVTVKLIPTALVCPDDHLHNGDQARISAALVNTHWAMVVGVS